MVSKKFASYIMLPAVLLFAAACNDNSSPFVPDYSTVPELPVNLTDEADWVTDEGVRVYVANEGRENGLEVGIRDEVTVWYTSRTLDTERILQSTYSNGFTSPVTLPGVAAQTTILYVQKNLPLGVVGMIEGERRVLVFTDSLTTATVGIILDIEVYTIDY